MAECATCGAAFAATCNAHKYCSDKCRPSNRRFGPKHKVAKESGCEVCGAHLVRHGRGPAKKYCSTKCRNEARKRLVNNRCKVCGVLCSVSSDVCRKHRGGQGSAKAIGKKACKVCGETFEYIKTQRSGRARVVCSVRCAGIRAKELSEKKRARSCLWCGSSYAPKSYSYNVSYMDEEQRQLYPTPPRMYPLFCQSCRPMRPYLGASSTWQPATASCARCGSEFPRRGGQIYCSEECAYLTRHGERPACTCKACGAQFVPEIGNGRRTYCSRRCHTVQKRRDAKKLPGYKSQRRAQRQRRRAAKAGARVETVKLEVVAERDSCRCGICGQRVDMRLSYPHLKSATLDHIIPLASGGEHSYRNIQLAHFICNSRKSSGSAGSQLRIFGVVSR